MLYWKAFNYLFKLSSNDYKKELALMVTLDEAITLMHTNARLTKIKRNSRTCI